MHKKTWVMVIALCVNGALFAGTAKPKVEEKFVIPAHLLALPNLVAKLGQDDTRQYLMTFLQNTHPTRIVGSPGQAKAPDVIMNIIRGFEKDLPPSSANCCTLSKEPFTPDLARARKMYEADFEREIAKRYAPNHPTYIKWKSFTDSTLRFLSTLTKVQGANLVWERKGSVDPDSVLILGAHFDSMAHDPTTLKIDAKAKATGADDNASGVAVAISLIKLLSQIPLPKTVKIVFYDFGQIGSLGAVAMVKKNTVLLKSPKFAGHIDLMMLGYDSRDHDGEKKYGNMIMYLRSPEEPGALAAKKLGFWMRDVGKRSVPSMDFNPVENEFNQGDGSAYWEAGVPTLVFTQNWESDMNPNYHTISDFAETLNYQTLFKSYEFIASGVLAWAFDIMK